MKRLSRAAAILVATNVIATDAIAGSRKIPLPTRVEKISGVPVSFTGHAMLMSKAYTALDARVSWPQKTGQ